MLHFQVKVGTQVRPICNDALPDVTTESIGHIVMLRSIGHLNRDFHATIRWDNGTESFLNAVFFFKTVEVVNEQSCS